MNWKRITATLSALAFLSLMAGCNKQQKGTLNKVKSETNKAANELDKVARDAIKKVRGNNK